MVGVRVVRVLEGGGGRGILHDVAIRSVISFSRRSQDRVCGVLYSLSETLGVSRWRHCRDSTVSGCMDNGQSHVVSNSITLDRLAFNSSLKHD